MRFRLLCCIALALFCSISGSARAQDPWFGIDKAKHFSASAVFAGGGYAASILIVEAPWQRAVIGGNFAFALGIAKEIYDATGHGDPSFRDLTWDLIGCAVGVGIALLLDYGFRSSSPEDSARVQSLRTVSLSVTPGGLSFAVW
jgi:putative lipoprotein